MQNQSIISDFVTQTFMQTLEKGNKLCNDRKNQTHKWASKRGFSKEIKIDAVANLWNFL